MPRIAHGKRRRGQSSVLQALVFEYFDLLRLPVFGKGEIGRLQSFDRAPALIPGRDIDDHQLRGGFELEGPFGSFLRGLAALHAQHAD